MGTKWILEEPKGKPRYPKIVRSCNRKKGKAAPTRPLFRGIGVSKKDLEDMSAVRNSVLDLGGIKRTNLWLRS